MILVIKNGSVIATHDDGTKITPATYPEAEVIWWNGHYRNCDLPTPDPRTDTEKALTYQSQRRAVYPPIGEQLDMIYWDQVNGTTKWHDLITRIKQTYPATT